MNGMGYGRKIKSVVDYLLRTDRFGSVFSMEMNGERVKVVC